MVGRSFVAAVGCLSAWVSADVSHADRDLVAQCVKSYIEAFETGASLANGVGCDWRGLSDQPVADAIRSGVVAYLERRDSVVGYKVTFSDDGSVVGVLMSSMLLPSGSTIELSSGSRILVEADLMVRVRSPLINDATSLEDVASSIDQIYPFMESSNMMLPKGTPRRKSTWTATNGNVRWGVLGSPIDIIGDSAIEIVKKLGELEVSLIGPEGNELQREPMARHPLESVLHLLQEIARTDASPLRPGDLISLGNFGRPRFPQPDQSYSTQYHGLSDAPPRVTVRFR